MVEHLLRSSSYLISFFFDDQQAVWCSSDSGCSIWHQRRFSAFGSGLAGKWQNMGVCAGRPPDAALFLEFIYQPPQQCTVIIK